MHRLMEKANRKECQKKVSFSDAHDTKQQEDKDNVNETITK